MNAGPTRAAIARLRLHLVEALVEALELEGPDRYPLVDNLRDMTPDLRDALLSFEDERGKDIELVCPGCAFDGVEPLRSVTAPLPVFLNANGDGSVETRVRPNDEVVCPECGDKYELRRFLSAEGEQ